MENDSRFLGLENIDEFLASKGNGKPVEVTELEEIIKIIAAKTNLSFDESKQIVELFFQEIRSLMIEGKIISLLKFGKFFIVSPKVTKSKGRVFPKFKMSKILLKAMNGK